MIRSLIARHVAALKITYRRTAGRSEDTMRDRGYPADLAL